MVNSNSEVFDATLSCVLVHNLCRYSICRVHSATERLWCKTVRTRRVPLILIRRCMLCSVVQIEGIMELCDYLKLRDSILSRACSTSSARGHGMASGSNLCHVDAEDIEYLTEYSPPNNPEESIPQE